MSITVSEPNGASRSIPSGRHMKLPPEKFYWALLDASTLPNRSGKARQLGYLFETALPIPIEKVHARYAKLPGVGKGLRDRWLACGMQIENLHGELEIAGPTVRTLNPSGLPGILDYKIDPDSLNLLTGNFEPKSVRALRRRWMMLVAVAIPICAAMLVFGFERRRLHYQDGLTQLQTARSSIYTTVLGASVPNESASGGSGAQPLELRLTAEMRQLQQTRQAPSSVTAPIDVSEILAQLLEKWPADLIVQTESVLITPTAMTIRGSMQSTGDVQELANALVKLEGWQVEQPQASTSGQVVQATLQLRPIEEHR